MKKYLIAFLILVMVIISGKTVQASSIDELASLVSDLKAQVLELKGQISATALSAVMPVIDSQLEAKQVPLPADVAVKVPIQLPVAPVFTAPVSYGQKGEEVLKLQNFLVGKNLLPVASVTGYYGRNTMGAVRDFQIANKIPGATGTVVGPKTLKVITTEVAGLPASQVPVISYPKPVAPQVPVIPALPVPIPTTTSPATTVPVTTSTSGPSCEVDLISNTHTCDEFISVISQASGKALVKITLDPAKVSKNTKVKFDVSFRSDVIPDGWVLNIGDSNTNDGYGGDGSTSNNDTELQILSNKNVPTSDFSVFGNDQTPASHTLDNNRYLFDILRQMDLTGKTISFVIGNEYLMYDFSSANPSLMGTMQSSDLYALAGQNDTQGPENYDLYAGFNRVVAGTHRSGTGVMKVKITFVEVASATETTTTTTDGCKSGYLYSTIDGQPCSKLLSNETTTTSTAGMCVAGYKYALSWGSRGIGNTQFSLPYELDTDSIGNVYVPDTRNHRVVKFDSQGKYLLQFGTFGASSGQMNIPYGLGIDASDNVYVADTYNSRIEKFNSNGVHLSSFGRGVLNHPAGVAFENSTGNIYVTDVDNRRVAKFDSRGELIKTFGSYGTGNGQFTDLRGIVVAPNGNVYVADNGGANRIEVFNSNGEYLFQFGTFGKGNGQFNNPADLDIDSYNNIFVIEVDGNRIQKFDLNGNYLGQFGSAGNGNGQFNGPLGIAIDTANNMYISDAYNYRVQKFVPCL